ncbi:beta-ketoacyl-[acyl-carrier-protein] synthase family protein [Candidatus Methylopumilus turicensis]|uniref:3-oxoacyl-[acyl-carrier-protein] synthase 2 n=1 Tax=Candidatus Methylopumilus turicensis TaxID=1581680 RepID=A0A0B7ITH1_9PROT|nr:beta-ketoacyl-[acyl-carrier-protein] synthase family protein [Candidatus Methylopumilus turicensis]CEN55594.1 3-oxoacyl-[acyl-carrier-protein] synthase 2 [Candidatus Methylopumilus turicensis]
MTVRRVAVTGLGVLSPVGNDPKTFFANLMAGRSGIKRMETDFVDSLDCKIAAYINDYDPLDHFVKNKAATMDRVTQFAVSASQQAINDAGLNLEAEDLERFGVYLGTGMGGAASIEEGYIRLYKEQARRLKPFTVLMAMNNAASAQVALDFGITGPDLTFCTACSSSSVAIGEAVKQIRHGYTDVMLAGGSEALLTFGTIKAWEALRTLADEDEANPSASCKPFSANRSGLVLGEGAGMVVLEDMDRAIARGAKIYAEVIGYGSSNDSTHITQPSIEGQARAMRKALKDANINADQLDYINAHGTGTKLNDITETNAIKQVCGNKIPVSSTKSMHGHLMGAAGAVEFVACMMAIEEQALPPTAHLLEPDPECDLDYIPNVGRKNVKVNTIMSNSFAFGGTSGVLIAKKII